jgi:hypothetical protein
MENIIGTWKNRENGAKESYVLNFKLTNQVF